MEAAGVSARNSLSIKNHKEGISDLTEQDRWKNLAAARRSPGPVITREKGEWKVERWPSKPKMDFILQLPSFWTAEEIGMTQQNKATGIC